MGLEVLRRPITKLRDGIRSRHCIGKRFSSDSASSLLLRVVRDFVAAVDYFFYA
jgi:hypothetical protein